MYIPSIGYRGAHKNGTDFQTDLKQVSLEGR